MCIKSDVMLKKALYLFLDLLTFGSFICVSHIGFAS